jgi:hypothetical protein
MFLLRYKGSPPTCSADSADEVPPRAVAAAPPAPSPRNKKTIPIQRSKNRNMFIYCSSSAALKACLPAVLTVQMKCRLRVLTVHMSCPPPQLTTTGF